MNLKIFLLAVSAVFSLPMDAQSRLRNSRSHKVDTVPVLVKSYMDSLSVSKAKIDSAAVESDVNDGRYYRLFAPLTFYHGVAGDMFSLEHDGDEQDYTLANIYMNRPDLVRNTERQLELVGPVINPYQESVTPETELVQKVVKKTENADIEAPVDIFVAKPNFWKFSGNYSLQLFQNYVSDNWYKGGESNYSLLGRLTMQANYNNKQKVKWENKLEMRLGYQTSKGDSVHSLKTSDDLIRYTSKLGLQASRKWYYTIQMVAQTQFAHGYKSNDKFVYSDFFSPFNLNLSVGMDYSVDWLNHRLKGSAHLAPLALNWKYVGREQLATRYGLKEGEHGMTDYGSECTFDLTWQVMDNLKWKTRLWGYTTYKRAEIEWENTLTFQFNRYISSNIFLYPRFDDGAKRKDGDSYWQFKEFMSIGFSYSF